MSIKLSVFLAVWLATGTRPAVAAPSLTATPIPYVRYCVASFFFGGKTAEDRTVPKDLDRIERRDWIKWRADAVRAERLFRSMPPAALKQKLVPLLSHTRKGYASYVSIAYVLASHDIDIHANVDRMLTAYEDQSGKADETPWDGKDKTWHWGSPLDGVPDGLAALYRKTKDPYILRPLFTIESDGIWAEALGDSLSSLLHDYPVPVLRFAVSNPGYLKHLERSVQDGDGPPAGIGAVLRKVANGRDPALAKAARVLLADMAKYPDTGADR